MSVSRDFEGGCRDRYIFILCWVLGGFCGGLVVCRLAACGKKILERKGVNHARRYDGGGDDESFFSGWVRVV